MSEIKIPVGCFEDIEDFLWGGISPKWWKAEVVIETIMANRQRLELNTELISTNGYTDAFQIIIADKYSINNNCETQQLDSHAAIVLEGLFTADMKTLRSIYENYSAWPFEDFLSEIGFEHTTKVTRKFRVVPYNEISFSKSIKKCTPFDLIEKLNERLLTLFGHLMKPQ